MKRNELIKKMKYTGIKINCSETYKGMMSLNQEYINDELRDLLYKFFKKVEITDDFFQNIDNYVEHFYNKGYNYDEIGIDYRVEIKGFSNESIWCCPVFVVKTPHIVKRLEVHKMVSYININYSKKCNEYGYVIKQQINKIINKEKYDERGYHIKHLENKLNQKNKQLKGKDNLIQKLRNER